MKTQHALAPLAAAMIFALCGSAFAAAPSGGLPTQQTPMNQNTTQNNTRYNHQNNNQNNNATRNMSQDAKDAYREGELWATYVVNPVLQSYNIDADVSGDTADLSGTVGTRYEKWLAEDLAQATPGIDTVTNNIKVNPDVVVVTLYTPASTYGQHVRDATTSARVNSMLLWNEYTDGLDVNVKTHNGKVTLTGTADTQKAKQRAAHIAMGVQGVTSVDNQLTVANTNMASSSHSGNSDNSNDSLSDQSISNRLQASYLYAFHVDATDLKVNVDNGKATLRGNVANDFERQRAIDIAQHTRGVTQVDASAIDVVGAPMQQTAQTGSDY